MKKLAALLILCSLVLSGCSTKTVVRDEDADTSDEAQTNSAQALRMLPALSHMYAEGVPYRIVTDTDMPFAEVWGVDYETLTERKLCSLDDANRSGSGSIYYIGSGFAVVGGSEEYLDQAAAEAYLKAIGENPLGDYDDIRPEKRLLTFVDIYDLNFENRRCLYEYSATSKDYTGKLDLSGCFFDGEYLYLPARLITKWVGSDGSGNSDEVIHTLLKLDCTTGESTEFAVYSGSNIERQWARGVFDGKVYYEAFVDGNAPDKLTRCYGVSVSDGSVTDYDAPQEFGFGGEQSRYYAKNERELYFFDAVTGTESYVAEIPEDWSIASSRTLCGHFVADFHVGDSGELRRFSCDRDGNFTELTLSYMTLDKGRRPIYVFEIGDGELMALVAENVRTVSYLGSGGDLVSSDAADPVWALISEEDFFKNRANYREITRIVS